MRPEFQNPGWAAATRESLGLVVEANPVNNKGAKKPAWPREITAMAAFLFSCHSTHG